MNCAGFLLTAIATLLLLLEHAVAALPGDSACVLCRKYEQSASQCSLLSVAWHLGLGICDSG